MDYSINGATLGGDIDPTYIKALRIAVECQSASISLIQQKCAVGFAYAGKIFNWMEEMGYVEPFDGKTRERKVLLSRERFDQMYADGIWKPFSGEEAAIGVDSASEEENGRKKPTVAYDEAYIEALYHVVCVQKAQAIDLRQALGLKLLTAGRYLDQMEQDGFVSPLSEHTPRRVYLTLERFNKMFGSYFTEDPFGEAPLSESSMEPAEVEENEAELAPAEVEEDEEELAPAEVEEDEEELAPAEVEEPEEEIEPAEVEEPEEELAPAEVEESEEEMEPAEVDESEEELAPAEIEDPEEELAPAEIEEPEEDMEPVEVEEPEEKLAPVEVEEPEEELEPAEVEEPEEEIEPAEVDESEEELAPAEIEEPEEEIEPAEIEEPEEEIEPAEIEEPEEELEPVEVDESEEELAPAEVEEPEEELAPAEDEEPEEESALAEIEEPEEELEPVEVEEDEEEGDEDEIEEEVKPKKDSSKVDPVFVKALSQCLRAGGASIAIIQRKCNVGFIIANSCLSWMKRMGYVDSDGKTMLITQADFDEIYGV